MNSTVTLCFVAKRLEWPLDGMPVMFQGHEWWNVCRAEGQIDPETNQICRLEHVVISHCHSIGSAMDMITKLNDGVAAVRELASA